jgi:hypothetical protein
VNYDRTVFIERRQAHGARVSANAGANERTGAYAKALYAKVLEQYGTKPQLWEAARNGQANGQNPAGKGSAPAAPRCPEHDKPMAHRKGRFGAFWSCPTRQPDGSWCAYTQQISPASNGQQAPSLSA